MRTAAFPAFFSTVKPKGDSDLSMVTDRVVGTHLGASVYMWAAIRTHQGASLQCVMNDGCRV